MPCILFWKQSHFVVLYSIKKTYHNKYRYYIADPAKGKINFSEEEFIQCWIGDNDSGIVSFVEPNNDFPQIEIPIEARDITLSTFITSYISPFKRYFVGLITALCFGSIFALGLPFLTQILIHLLKFRPHSSSLRRSFRCIQAPNPPRQVRSLALLRPLM